MEERLAHQAALHMLDWCSFFPSQGEESASLTPEQELALAMISSAVEDLSGQGSFAKDRRGNRESALQWVTSTEFDDCLSLEFTCSLLRWDVEKTRQYLLSIEWSDGYERGRPWTEVDDAKLVDLWLTTPRKEIARQLDRTVRALGDHARRLFRRQLAA